MEGLGLFPAVNTAAFLLCIVFLTYVTLIVITYLRDRPSPPGDPSAAVWCILMPCLDEADVVAGSVRRMLHDLPDVHIWCIDDASEDGTAEILHTLAAAHERVHVVSRRLPAARKGKGDALNSGWRSVGAWVDAHGIDRSTVIVGVVDADGNLDPDCLGALAAEPYFGTPEVGAVQLAVRIANRTTGDRRPPTSRLRRLLVDLQDVEFVGPIGAMQLLRRHTASVSMGGNGQFTRLTVLDEIAGWAGTPWHGALLEDFELGLFVLLSGHRTAYCHHSYVAQEGLESIRLLVRQRSRWAQGSMQCARYLKAVLASRRIGNLGAFEIGYFLLMPWMQLAGTVVYALAYAILTWYLLAVGLDPGAWIASGQWGVLPLVLVGGIGPFFIWGPIYRRRVEPTTTRRRAAVLGLSSWLYSNLHYVASWWAFFRLVDDRDDWKKSRRVTSVDATLVPDADVPVGTADVELSRTA